MRSLIEAKSMIPAAEKSLYELVRPVPQTDTGGQVENTKAIERTVVRNSA